MVYAAWAAPPPPGWPPLLWAGHPPQEWPLGLAVLPGLLSLRLTAPGLAAPGLPLLSNQHPQLAAQSNNGLRLPNKSTKKLVKKCSLLPPPYYSLLGARS